ncbi:MAG: AraC family transcriptional regulator [Deltaproteobacteria bacterium]|nr:MAG: AraC family transcriptional regulator [Deltaproteobacteria bacterium]
MRRRVAARPVIDALAERGIEVEPTLLAAQLSREALASNENRLPHQSMLRLWETAAVAAHDRSFGVHVAEALPTGLTQYVRLIYDHSDWRLVLEPRQVRLIRRVAAPAPQYDEFSLTLLLVRSRQSSGTQWTPEQMAFQHEGSADNRELARVFACPILFGASETEMRFAPSILQLPHRRSDSRLLAILTRYADSLLSSLPSRGDLVASASSAIARQMAKALPSLASTAAAVHLPERTFQRRLAEYGASHSALVGEVRRDLALKYIGDAGLSIGEIGYLLHFSDSTAFHRAFRRWTGEAPTRYRRRLFEQSRQP